MPTPEEIYLADLQAQRVALRRAIRSGVLTITHGDKSIKHRSMKEMQVALADIEAEIGGLDPLAPVRRRVRYASIRKGL